MWRLVEDSLGENAAAVLAVVTVVGGVVWRLSWLLRGRR